MQRLFLILTAVALFSLFSIHALGQGETTSAIVGQATDATGAVVSRATVTITSLDTGSRRSAKTDEAGRFNFPQLKPGAYAVRIEAQGFEAQEAHNIFSGLGQKQTVNFILSVARSNERVEVGNDFVGGTNGYGNVEGRNASTLARTAQPGSADKRYRSRLDCQHARCSVRLQQVHVETRSS